MILVVVAAIMAAAFALIFVLSFFFAKLSLLMVTGELFPVLEKVSTGNRLLAAAIALVFVVSITYVIVRILCEKAADYLREREYR